MSKSNLKIEAAVKETEMLKLVTPEEQKVGELKKERQADVIAELREENARLRKKSLEAGIGTGNNPAVDRKELYDSFVQWLEFQFPEGFSYEQEYMARMVANAATFLGRNKSTRKKSIVARDAKAVDAGEDLDNVYREFGVAVPEIDRSHQDESLAHCNESLVRCKVLQQAAVVVYESKSERAWVEPRMLEERRPNQRQVNDRNRDPNVRSKRESSEDLF
jgi:hypothetical protein